jgi:hypothetical protein
LVFTNSEDHHKYPDPRQHLYKTIEAETEKSQGFVPIPEKQRNNALDNIVENCK